MRFSFQISFVDFSKIILLVFFLFEIPCNSFAVRQKKNCLITVKYYYKTGVTEAKTYLLISKSKIDCFKNKELFKENSTPQIIDRKDVSTRWTEE